MSSEVSDMIAALRAGAMSLEEVAAQFRQRPWPRVRAPEPESYLQMAEQTLNDPEPYVAGSFDDVSAAFHRGDLTGDEYRVLAEAAAESINDAARGSQGGDGTEGREDAGEQPNP